MSEYTEGICADGAAILCDGQMLTISEVLHRLNSIRELEAHPCPHVVTSDEGTQHCSLAEGRVRELETRADNAEAEVEAAWAVAERCRKDRADVLMVKTTEGLTASEWILRTAKAEAERDRLYGEQMGAADWVQQSRDHLTRAEKAEAEVKRLRDWLEHINRNADGLVDNMSDDALKGKPAPTLENTP